MHIEKKTVYLDFSRKYKVPWTQVQQLWVLNCKPVPAVIAAMLCFAFELLQSFETEDTRLWFQAFPHIVNIVYSINNDDKSIT